MCMCVYVYACVVRAYVFKCECVCKCACMYVCVYMCLCVCVLKCVQRCVYVYSCVYVCVVSMYMCLWAYVYVYACMCLSMCVFNVHACISVCMWMSLCVWDGLPLAVPRKKHVEPSLVTLTPQLSPHHEVPSYTVVCLQNGPKWATNITTRMLRICPTLETPKFGSIYIITKN